METDIYRSKAIQNAFLFIKAGSNINELPKPILAKLGELVYFKSIVLIPDSPLIAADPNVVINNIKTKGYHIQGAKVSTDVSEAGAAIGAGILAASLGAGPVGALVGAAIGYFLAHKAGENEDAS